MASLMRHAERIALARDGYVVVRGAVPKVLVNRAVQAINHSVGNGMPTDDMRRARSQSYCAELQDDPVITDLFNATPARSILESLLGEDAVAPARRAQIALRFPAPPGTRAAVPGVHIDGLHTPDNGVPKGTLLSFTALVGVLLSDLPETDSGNFTVWPGSHEAYAAYFAQHGPEDLIENFWQKGMPKLDLGAPVQLTGRAGDVIVANYLLGHTVGPHVATHIRYATFFRLAHPRLESERMAALVEPWLHWPGLADVLEPSVSSSAR